MPRQSLGSVMQAANMVMTEKGYTSLEEINEGGCFEWATEVFSRIENCVIFGKYYKGGFHAFIQYRGKFYDSETPQGIKNWRLLPYFKRCQN